METLHFDRMVKCDWCGHEEICSITHYGTTNYNRLICTECALSINQDQKVLFGSIPFDLNNSTIIFKSEWYVGPDAIKKHKQEDQD